MPSNTPFYEMCALDNPSRSVSFHLTERTTTYALTCVFAGKRGRLHRQQLINVCLSFRKETFDNAINPTSPKLPLPRPPAEASIIRSEPTTGLVGDIDPLRAFRVYVKGCHLLRLARESRPPLKALQNSSYPECRYFVERVETRKQDIRWTDER